MRRSFGPEERADWICQRKIRQIIKQKQKEFQVEDKHQKKKRKSQVVFANKAGNIITNTSDDDRYFLLSFLSFFLCVCACFTSTIWSSEQWGSKRVKVDPAERSRRTKKAPRK